MHFHLHLPTLDIVSVFTTLVAAGVSLLAWYRHRDAVALRSWAAALVLGSVGALLFTLRGPGTSAALFVAADALGVASYATMCVSMRRFNGDTAPPLRMTIVVAAITCIFVLLVTISWQMGAALRAQSLLFSLFVGGLALATAAWRWRRRGRLGAAAGRTACAAAASPPLPWPASPAPACSASACWASTGSTSSTRKPPTWPGDTACISAPCACCW